MPLFLTDKLGPQVDAKTGGWIPNSETYIIGQAATLQPTFFYKAQVSGIYLVTVIMQTTSNATLGLVLPRVDYYGAWDQGVGKQLFTQPAAPFFADAASSIEATSSVIMAIRAAASDIFIRATMSANGALPIVNLYFRVSRPE